MKIPRRPTRLWTRLSLVRGRFRRNKPGKLSFVLLQIRLLFWIFCKALIRDANAAFIFIASLSSGSYYHLRMPSRRCLWFADRFQRHWRRWKGRGTLQSTILVVPSSALSGMLLNACDCLVIRWSIFEKECSTIILAGFLGWWQSSTIPLSRVLQVV